MTREQDPARDQRHERILELYQKEQTSVLTTGDIENALGIGQGRVTDDMESLVEREEMVEVHRAAETNCYYRRDPPGLFSSMGRALTGLWDGSAAGKLHVVSAVGLVATVLGACMITVNVAQGNVGTADRNVINVASVGVPSLVGFLLSAVVLYTRS